jgi:hypothetical protein
MEEKVMRISVKPPSGFLSATTMVSPEITSITRPSKARHSEGENEKGTAQLGLPGDGTGGR